MSQSGTYTLKHPYTTAAGQKLVVITLNRLKVKDIRTARNVSKDPADWDEPLIAAMTGMLPEDLSEMDLQDYRALQERFQQAYGLDGQTGDAV
ncbi:phage tail assembly protein [Salmonella enterica]|nr:phage tail assembly protein [Salmonella enterica]EKZ9425981.1 phage tail assembly protein [Salmonella enterica]ELB8084888.1 phage tail assembly protein [Salmonella enterica]ELJ1892601.1 phage tail assembly protein [Salmonella enterica]ELX2841817.1 phage tail assembly protein [Salmonella enterica]